MNKATNQVSSLDHLRLAGCRGVSTTAACPDSRPTSLRSEKITDFHLQKRAIVYVRQSTQQQMLKHRESTARQYALADRAVALGWPLIPDLFFLSSCNLPNNCSIFQLFFRMFSVRSQGITARETAVAIRQPGGLVCPGPFQVAIPP